VSCLAAAAVLLLAFLVVEARSDHPMFDLGLFRLPTFVGGDIAAFGVSAGIFSLLLYLVLYLQDVLGYTALQTGLRLLILSGGILVVSGIAGRLSSKVPVRALIGPGLLLVGAGLLLMRGLTASSSWTHLIPGLIVAGVGVGLINPPLASTAVGVVEPRRSGMASGLNSTFRQVGIATGIAALGAVFQSQITDKVRTGLASTPGASRHAVDLAHATAAGALNDVLKAVPPSARGHVASVAKGAFASGLNTLFMVSAIVAFVGAVLAAFLVREKDFATAHGAAPQEAPAHA
jgi:predicted MFS family arabinose efflux permease